MPCSRGTMAAARWTATSTRWQPPQRAPGQEEGADGCQWALLCNDAAGCIYAGRCKMLRHRRLAAAAAAQLHAALARHAELHQGARRFLLSCAIADIRTSCRNRAQLASWWLPSPGCSRWGSPAQGCHAQLILKLLTGAECDMASLKERSTLLRSMQSQGENCRAIGADQTYPQRSPRRYSPGTGGPGKGWRVCGRGLPEALVRDGGQAGSSRGLRHLRPERRLAAAQVGDAGGAKPWGPAGRPSHTAECYGKMCQIGRVARGMSAPRTAMHLLAPAGARGLAPPECHMITSAEPLHPCLPHHRNGAKVTLFESEASCGGHTLTDTSSGFPVDLGFQVGGGQSLCAREETQRHGCCSGC